MIRIGARNLITDVPGILVGNAEDHGARSGTTVVLPEQPAVCAVDVRGGAPGTRETDALGPTGLVEHVHAVVLSGGSAFGLDAAAGAMAWLAARGRGFRIGEAVVPVVPAAILFELANGGDKGWGEAPPYRELGRRAIEAAAPAFALGNAGAGLGARAGALKGGLGSASFVDEALGASVGALAAVNCFGSCVMPQSPLLWAFALEQGDELGGQPVELAGPIADLEPPHKPLGGHTTIAVVATDATLDRAQARRLAIMAHDGLARAIRPVHTPFDGDSVFVLATGRVPLADPPADLLRLGSLAADATARAVARGVYEAEDLGRVRCYRSLHGHHLRASRERGGRR